MNSLEEKCWFEEQMENLKSKYCTKLEDGDYHVAYEIIEDLVIPIVARKKSEVRSRNKQFRDASFAIKRLVIQEISKLGITCTYDFIDKEFEFSLEDYDSDSDDEEYA